MSSLELLKTQIDVINNRLVIMEQEIENRKKSIADIKISKEELDIKLKEHETKYDDLIKNYNYLNDVKQSTTDNYNQILASANTLLDILKNKFDGL